MLLGCKNKHYSPLFLCDPFKWTERTVSHGCVRIEEPYNMAEFLLKGNKKFSYDDFRIKLGMAALDEERLVKYISMDTFAHALRVDTTENHFLHEQIPLYFLYQTIFFNSSGIPVFRNDVYGYNQKVYAAMKGK